MADTVTLVDITPSPTQLKWQEVLASVAKANAGSDRLNTLNKYSRLDFGKEVEDKIIEYLAAHGLPIRKTTSQQDMVDLLDAIVTLNGVEYKAQVKFRARQRPDIGIELYRPFYARIDHERTRLGRDMRSQYDLYIILINGIIYIIWGKAQKAFINLVLNEWQDEEQPRPYKSPRGAELKFVRDEGADDGGDSKMIIYIQPKAYVDQRTCMGFNEQLSKHALFAEKGGLTNVLVERVGKWSGK